MACGERCGRAVLAFAAASAVLAVAGCGGSGERDGGRSQGALAGVSSREGRLDDRLERMERSWASAGEADRPAVRQRLKDIAWSTAEPFEVRAKAVELLAGEEGGEADTRVLVKLMLPREQSRGMVAMLCRLCVERGWVDATPALVRSYSRVVDAVREEERAERWALGELNPGVGMMELAWGVFLDPRTEAGPEGANFDARARADAWAVVSRLDETGAERRRLLAGTASSNAEVALMRSCAAELAALPNTPAEIEWTRSLFAPGNAENTAWRGEVARAVSGLGESQRSGLRMRHLEAIRWASGRRAEWLGRTREELLSELGARLSGRQLFQRRVERDQRGDLRPETLEFWRGEMSWGDVLSVLVVDEVVGDAGFQAALWPMLDQDRRDRTTEYGGLIQEVVRAGGVRPILYVPRSAAREGDMAFPEPADMTRQGDRALAVFHFHASELELLDHAGPSLGDLNYARASGRTCVVFTSLRERRLAVDYYQPNGVVIDLGEIPR